MAVALLAHRSISPGTRYRKVNHCSKAESQPARQMRNSFLFVLCFFQGPVLGRADVVWKASFASAFTNHAVLQRAPARPIVYGVCTSDAQHASEVRSSTANISIQVEVQSIESGANYIVGPSQVHWLNGSYVRWSANLRPGQPQDGAHTMSVSCGAMQFRWECSVLCVSCR